MWVEMRVVILVNFVGVNRRVGLLMWVKGVVVSLLVVRLG